MSQETFERIDQNHRNYAMRHIERAIAQCGAMPVGLFAVQMINQHRHIHADLESYLGYGRIAQILLGSAIGGRDFSLFDQVFVTIAEIEIPAGNGKTKPFNTHIYNPTQWGNRIFHALAHEYGARPISVAEPIETPAHPDWLDWSKYGLPAPPVGWREGIGRGLQPGDQIDWDAIGVEGFYEPHTGIIQEISDEHCIALENGLTHKLTAFTPHLPEAIGATIEGLGQS